MEDHCVDNIKIFTIDYEVEEDLPIDPSTSKQTALKPCNELKKESSSGR